MIVLFSFLEFDNMLWASPCGRCGGRWVIALDWGLRLKFKKNNLLL